MKRVRVKLNPEKDYRLPDGSLLTWDVKSRTASIRPPEGHGITVACGEFGSAVVFGAVRKLPNGNPGHDQHNPGRLSR